MTRTSSSFPASSPAGSAVQRMIRGSAPTDLDHHNGTLTVEERTDAIVAMATTGEDGPTGTYTDRHGTVPW